jgi:hypothetical protein
MVTFLEKIAPVVDFRRLHPLRCARIGFRATESCDRSQQNAHCCSATYLNGKSEDPSGWFVRSYPRFRLKYLLRFLFDHFQSELLFNLLLSTRPMRVAAGIIYFHQKGVFASRLTPLLITRMLR